MADSEQVRRATFVQRMAPLAIAWGKITKIPPDLLLGIAAHESNFGNVSGNALFGIKGSGSGPQQTWEYVNGQRVATTASFQGYRSPTDAFKGFVDLIRGGRYKPAWDYLQRTGDSAGWLDQVNAAGYATDPAWSGKVRSFTQSSVAPLLPGRTVVRGVRTGTGTPRQTATSNALPKDAQRGWSLPTQGPVTSLFGEPFGMDRGRTYQGRAYANFNAGVDFGAQAGAPVFSLTPGVVVAAGPTNDGWGYAVRVRDPDGRIHNYGHTSGARVKVGDQVSIGTNLAAVAGGQVGTSTGPHLSYDVWEADGSPVDPTPFLVQGGRGESAVHTSVSHDPAKARAPSFMGAAQPPGRAAAAASLLARLIQARMAAPRQKAPTVTPRGAAAGATPQGAPAVSSPIPSTTTSSSTSTSSSQRTSGRQVTGAEQTLYEGYRTQLLALQQPLRDAIANRDRHPQGSAEWNRADDVVFDLETRNDDLIARMAAIQKLAPTVSETDSDRATNTLANNLSVRKDARDQTAHELDIFKLFYDMERGDRSDAVGIYDTSFDIINAIFGNETAISKLMVDILAGNRDDAYRSYTSQEALAKLGLDSSAAYIDAQAKEQAAQIAYAAETLARAKFIQDETVKLKLRQLPADIEYWPGFEPNTALNSSLATLGIAPIVFRATKVDFAELDPMRSLGLADASLRAQGISKGGFDLAGLDAARQNIQTLPGYQGSDIDPSSMVPEGISADDILAGLMDWMPDQDSQGGTSSDALEKILAAIQAGKLPPEAIVDKVPVTSSVAPGTGAGSPSLAPGMDQVARDGQARADTAGLPKAPVAPAAPTRPSAPIQHSDTPGEGGPGLSNQVQSRSPTKREQARQAASGRQARMLPGGFRASA